MSGMTAITLADGNASFRVNGKQFYQVLDILREHGCTYDPKSKLWSQSSLTFEDTFNDLTGQDIEFTVSPPNWRELVEKEKEESRELKKFKTRRTYRDELMYKPPLQGKPGPNERYQMEDFLRGLQQNRFLYNWTMGLGKSYVLTALLEHLRYYGDIDKAIICSTNIGVLNLKNELLGFGRNQKDSEILVITGAESFKTYEDRDVLKPSVRTLITTYDSFKLISDFYYDKSEGKKGKGRGKKYKISRMPLQEWGGEKGIGLFLDENHSLGNPQSKRTTVFMTILPFCDFRYLFTGTLADKNEKLYVPCKILDKSLVDGMNYSEWCRTYNNLDRWGNVDPNNWDTEKINDLNRRLLENYASKRSMKECLDLPPNVKVPTIYVEMSDKHREIYQNFVRTKLENSTEKETPNVMFQILQSSLDNPETLLDSASFSQLDTHIQNLVLGYDYIKDNAKADIFRKIVDTKVENNERGIIWYYHPKTKDALERLFRDLNPFVVSAEVPKNERVPLVEEFKKSNSPLLIASIKVANTSITVTQCSYEIYAEKTYSFTEYDQAQGRIWRPGQDKITETYTVRFNRSLDNAQELNLATKGDLLSKQLNKAYLSHSTWKKMVNLSKDDLFGDFKI